MSRVQQRAAFQEPEIRVRLTTYQSACREPHGRRTGRCHRWDLIILRETQKRDKGQDPKGRQD